MVRHWRGLREIVAEKTALRACLLDELSSVQGCQLLCEQHHLLPLRSSTKASGQPVPQHESNTKVAMLLIDNGSLNTRMYRC